MSNDEQWDVHYSWQGDDHIVNYASEELARDAAKIMIEDGWNGVRVEQVKIT